jgi:NADPH-dependent 2,4-dienoyl-CoA reductase/sulfur reductase-like enzyme
MSGPLAIIGGDAAGMSAAAVARRRDSDRDILVLEQGPYTSYSACGIPYFLGGLVDGPDRLIARSPDEFRQAGIDVRTRCEVTDIDLAARTLVYRDHVERTDHVESFDELVYATGATAVAPVA